MPTKRWVVALGSILALCGCGQDPSDGLTLTEEEQRALDRELRMIEDEAKADGQNPYQTFTSEYNNATLAGLDAAGEPIVIALGRHAAKFPYFESNAWDSALVVVAGRGYRASGRMPLSIDFNSDARDDGAELPGAQSEGEGTIAFSGTMLDVEGRSASVSFSLSLDYVRFPALFLGQLYNFLRWTLDRVPGMRWYPYALTQRGGAMITIDGQSHAIATLAGQLEHGDFVNLRAKEFAIAYDYLSLASVAGGDPYAYVRFVAHPLAGRGVLGKVLDLFLSRVGSASVTLAAGKLTQGDARGVEETALPPPDRFLVRDTIDLGLATLERQIIETRDRDGRAVYGLREIFHAR